jgi:hypothetical protein
MCHANPSTPKEESLIQFTLTDADSPADAIDTMLLVRFATGALPFAQGRRLQRGDGAPYPAEVGPLGLYL